MGMFAREAMPDGAWRRELAPGVAVERAVGREGGRTPKHGGGDTQKALIRVWCRW